MNQNTKMTAAGRKRMIEERRRSSSVWRVIHWLGSMQLALILLATIALACAVATFAESGFSAKIARAYIYKAPWFQLWLVVLCINLFAVTITRWPWLRKHTGFIITHYGIIILLVGAMVGMNTGFEGNVTLRKDAPPISRVVTSRSVIQLESPADSYLYIAAFDADLAKPSAKRPRQFPVPGTQLKIVADDYAPSLLREPKLVASENADAAPGALLRIHSARMGQTHDIALHAKSQPFNDFFGMAEIRIAAGLPKIEPAGPTETRMVFAKFAPISEGGTPGVIVRLSEDGEKVSIFGEDGHGAAYPRKEAMNQPLTEAGATVVIEKFWPDFSMKDGKPVSVSDQPNNPAVLARITPLSPEGKPHQRPRLDIRVDNDRLDYQVARAGHVTATGTVKAGESFPLGWADWTAEVVSVSGASALVHDVKPGAAHGMEAPVPGFRAALEGPDGRRGPARWVESGEVIGLTDGRNVVRIGYGLETRPLPFSVRLVRFDVPRDEGAETPSNFLATVEFQDAKTGATKTGVAKMNHPASYPGTLLANITGFNYKFSQAEWNPRNLEETTLQVLYDPGWLLKWIGSLAICIGIAIQFYWKPKSRHS